MQRRTMLRNMIVSNKQKSIAIAPPPVNDLSPYTGTWTKREAAQLLRRTTFGFSYKNLQELEDLGLTASVDLLTKSLPAPEPPINYDFESDPEVPLGKTWIDAGYDPVNNSNAYRNRSIIGWTMKRLLSGEINIREKMTLFWHNHFVTSNVTDARFRYRYISLFRDNPLGNFRDLTKDITIDPTMLRYLNGRQNSRFSPNENYARELLELFTIGKGPLAAPGDYTYYTEQDVRAVARILTGWRDTGYKNVNNVEVGATFIANRHDSDQKILSHRFDGKIFEDEGEKEFSQLIDVIFEKEEVSKFISRNLYRWFVYYKIDEEVETTIIEPMAQIIRDNDYSIKEAMIALLNSSHFYNVDQTGCMIKNPIDYATGLMVGLEMNNAPEDLLAEYTYWLRNFNNIRRLQMEYFSPPSVAGWSPYYQEPTFYQVWLNSVTMPLRQQLSDVRVQRGVTLGDFRARANFLEIIKQFSDAREIIDVINDFVLLLLPKPITDDQVLALKEIVIPGLPNFEWTVEYDLHLQNPGDEALAESINNKLRDMVLYMTRMPEFQLS